MVVAHRTASFGDKFLLTLLFYQIAAFLWAFFFRCCTSYCNSPGRNGDPRRAGGPPGALRPEAPEKPRPPAGYAVPHRAPARDRAGTHVAGLDLRRSYRDHLPILAPLGPGTSPTYWTTKLRFIHFPLR